VGGAGDANVAAAAPHTKKAPPLPAGPSETVLAAKIQAAPCPPMTVAGSIFRPGPIVEEIAMRWM
jgi:hypothetical protein